MTTEPSGVIPSSEKNLVDGIPLDRYIAQKVDERVVEALRVNRLSAYEIAFKIADALRLRNGVSNP